MLFDELICAAAKTLGLHGCAHMLIPWHQVMAVRSLMVEWLMKSNPFARTGPLDVGAGKYRATWIPFPFLEACMIRSRNGVLHLNIFDIPRHCVKKHKKHMLGNIRYVCDLQSRSFFQPLNLSDLRIPQHKFSGFCRTTRSTNHRPQHVEFLPLLLVAWPWFMLIKSY